MTIGRLDGVPIRLHWGWFLVMALLAATGQFWLAMLGLMAVLTHELAHVVVAKSLGQDVAAVDLLPYGGRSLMPGLRGRDPALQAVVALAGPAASLLVALAARWLTDALPGPNGLARVFWDVNVGLALVNLLPAPPLDGAHLWAALRAGRVGYDRAEREVAGWGRAMAAAAAAAALMTALFGHLVWQLPVLAVLMAWVSREPRHSAYWPVRDMAVREAVFPTHGVWGVSDYAVREDVPLGDVLRAMRPRRLHRVAVLSAGQVYLGTLWERDLLEALRQAGPETRVGDILRRQN